MKLIRTITYLILIIIFCLGISEKMFAIDDKTDTENLQSKATKISKKIDTDTSKQNKKPINTTYTPVIDKDITVDTGNNLQDTKSKIDTSVVDPYVGQMVIKCFDKRNKIKSLLVEHWEGLNKIGVIVSLKEFAKKAHEVTDALYENDDHKKLDAEGVMEATASTFIK